MKRKYRLVVSSSFVAICGLIHFAKSQKDDVVLSWNHLGGSHTVYFISSKKIVVRMLLQAALERTTGHAQLDMLEDSEYSRIIVNLANDDTASRWQLASQYGVIPSGAQSI
jgi:hypothetical protein